MSAWPSTDPSLLLGLADPANHEAWQRFDSLYRPVIYRFVRRSGVDHHGAEDVTADVMRRVARAAARWTADRPPEKFAAWLTQVAKNALLNLVCRELSRRGTGGTTHQMSLDQRPAASSVSRERWEDDRRSEMMRLAADQIRDEFDSSSWQAFWMTHVEGESIADVAAKLEKSVGAIYAIRSRIVRRLRSQVRVIEDAEGP